MSVDFFHWVTSKALQRLVADGVLSSELVALKVPVFAEEEGQSGTQVRLYLATREALLEAADVSGSRT